jgi:hypothetical protein
VILLLFAEHSVIQNTIYSRGPSLNRQIARLRVRNEGPSRDFHQAVGDKLRPSRGFSCFGNLFCDLKPPVIVFLNTFWVLGVKNPSGLTAKRAGAHCSPQRNR